jgi:hypothetical protein
VDLVISTNCPEQHSRFETTSFIFFTDAASSFFHDSAFLGRIPQFPPWAMSASPFHRPRPIRDGEDKQKADKDDNRGDDSDLPAGQRLWKIGRFGLTVVNRRFQ